MIRNVYLACFYRSEIVAFFVNVNIQLMKMCSAQVALFECPFH